MRLPVSAQVLRKEEPETRVKLPPLLMRGARPGRGVSGDEKQTGRGARGERPRAGRRQTVSRKREAALLGRHKGCLRTVSTEDSHTGWSVDGELPTPSVS